MMEWQGYRLSPRSERCGCIGHTVLAYLFGVGEWTVSRAIARVLPILEASGRDSMRRPDPGKKRRRQHDQLLADTPELIVLIDTFEQRVQRHRDRKSADAHYSGKKKQCTLKSQITVDEEMDRNHRQDHSMRVRAIAGLVNRQLRRYALC
jgi:hypothetical protein